MLYDGTGSTRGISRRTFSVEYTAVSRDRETLAERTTWYRNFGIFNWLQREGALSDEQYRDRIGRVDAMMLLSGNVQDEADAI